MKDKLTVIEKIFLEGIEGRCDAISKSLQECDEDLNDFATSTEEEDADRILKKMRLITDEILLCELPKLLDDIDDFKNHRKQRQL